MEGGAGWWQLRSRIREITGMHGHHSAGLPPVSKNDRWPQRCFLCHRTGGVEAIDGHSLRCTNCHSIWPAGLDVALPTPVLNGWQDDETLALLRKRRIHRGYAK